MPSAAALAAALAQLGLAGLDRRARLAQRRPRHVHRALGAHRQFIARRVDAEQQLALLHGLVVAQRQPGDQPGNVRRQRHHIGADPRVTGPRRAGVAFPGENTSAAATSTASRVARRGHLPCNRFIGTSPHPQDQTGADRAVQRALEQRFVPDPLQHAEAPQQRVEQQQDQPGQQQRLGDRRQVGAPISTSAGMSALLFWFFDDRRCAAVLLQQRPIALQRLLQDQYRDIHDEALPRRPEVLRRLRQQGLQAPAETPQGGQGESCRGASAPPAM